VPNKPGDLVLLRRSYERLGFRLFVIRNNELQDKPEVVASMVRYVSGLSLPIPARKTKIEVLEWSVIKAFLDSNHLQSHGGGASLYLGLSHKNKLVAAGSFTVGETLVIKRFCTILDTQIQGGFQKLLAAAVRICGVPRPRIESWCDLRYATGQSYLRAGFKPVRETIGWNWTDGQRVFNRLRCRAGQSLTERERSAALGLVKIYDAGQRLYRKE
jgi:hypothetical protein